MRIPTLGFVRAFLPYAPYIAARAIGAYWRGDYIIEFELRGASRAEVQSISRRFLRTFSELDPMFGWSEPGFRRYMCQARLMARGDIGLLRARVEEWMRIGISTSARPALRRIGRRATG